MKIMIIESPFKGANKVEELRNRVYLEKCIRWCVGNGFTPYASHKMLTDALDDGLPAERSLGINAGLEMSVALLKHVPGATVGFFEDYGMSSGMAKAEERYLKEGIEFNFEAIGRIDA